jgi:hypothetical protein
MSTPTEIAARLARLREAADDPYTHGFYADAMLFVLDLLAQRDRELEERNGQLLSILVRDLGYSHEWRPIHGHAPMRHQHAWHLVFGEKADAWPVHPDIIAAVNEHLESMKAENEVPGGAMRERLGEKADALEALAAKLTERENNEPE